MQNDVMRNDAMQNDAIRNDRLRKSQEEKKASCKTACDARGQKLQMDVSINVDMISFHYFRAILDLW